MCVEARKAMEVAEAAMEAEAEAETDTESEAVAVEVELEAEVPEVPEALKVARMESGARGTELEGRAQVPEAANAIPASHTSGKQAKKRRVKASRAMRKQQVAVEEERRAAEAAQVRFELQAKKVASSRACLEAMSRSTVGWIEASDAELEESFIMQALRLMRAMDLLAASKPSHSTSSCSPATAGGGGELVDLLEAQAPVSAVLRLLQGGADANMRGGNGESALHVAVAAGDTALYNVGALLDFDADPDIQARTDGYTVLHRAVSDAQLGCVVMLLRAGADPDAISSRGALLPGAPLQLRSASMRSGRSLRSCPLFMAQMHCDLTAHLLSQCLVLVGGADVLQRDSATGRVPAVTAAERGLLTTATFLSAHQDVAHQVRVHTGDEAERALLEAVVTPAPVAS